MEQSDQAQRNDEMASSSEGQSTHLEAKPFCSRTFFHARGAALAAAAIAAEDRGSGRPALASAPAAATSPRRRIALQGPFSPQPEVNGRTFFHEREQGANRNQQRCTTRHAIHSNQMRPGCARRRMRPPHCGPGALDPQQRRRVRCGVIVVNVLHVLVDSRGLN